MAGSLLVENLPPIVTGLNARYFGDSGGTTVRYYWVVAKYPHGRSTLAGPVSVTTPGSLSKNNNVLIVWNPAPGAFAYDILYTTTNARPTAPGNIAARIGEVKNSFTDIGDSDNATLYAPEWAGTKTIKVAHAILDFAVDGGAIGAITPALTEIIPKDAIVLRAIVNSTTAVTSAGAATVAVGTTAGSSATSILAATAKGSLSADALILGVPNTGPTPFKMTADGSINFTVAAAVLTAGRIEVFAEYVIAQSD